VGCGWRGRCRAAGHIPCHPLMQPRRLTDGSLGKCASVAAMTAHDDGVGASTSRPSSATPSHGSSTGGSGHAPGPPSVHSATTLSHAAVSQHQRLVGGGGQQRGLQSVSSLRSGESSTRAGVGRTPALPRLALGRLPASVSFKGQMAETPQAP
jgi:hypothetical protein